MRYENSSKEMPLKPEEKRQIHEDYHKILEAVHTLPCYEQEALLGLIGAVLDSYKSLDKDVKEDVMNMGVAILEFEHDKIYEEGKEEGRERGREEGREEGKFEAAYNLEELGYNEETVCDMLRLDLNGYKEYKEKNNLNEDLKVDIARNKRI